MVEGDLVATGVEHLRDQADVGQRRPIAKAEPPAINQALHRLETAFEDPVAIPGIHLLGGTPEGSRQIVAHAQVVERVDIAGDCEGDGTHPGGSERFLRDQSGARA